MILRRISASKSLWRKHDLSKLILIPDASQNVSNITLKAIQFSKEPTPNIITSSTKSRCVRESWGEILIPLILPLTFASSINKLSPSITRMNNRGDKGHPCLMPRVAVKKGEGEPFTRMEKLQKKYSPGSNLLLQVEPQFEEDKSDESPINPIKCLSQI